MPRSLPLLRNPPRAVDELPRVVGGPVPDLDELHAALRRAGRRLEAAAMDVEALTGGRSAQPVWALRPRAGDGGPAGRYVVKCVSSDSARPIATGCGCIEMQLWRTGVFETLPAPLSCPIIDVAREADGPGFRLLMDDVSDGILPRGVVDTPRIEAMLRAVAGLHAAWWDCGDALAGVAATLDAATSVCTEAALQAACGDDRSRPPWVGRMLGETPLIGQFMPHFLDALGPDGADFYLALCRDRPRWTAALAREPSTLTQGDLRRANVAVFPGGVSLFDWDLANVAPGVCDVAWYWFLQFWAYPPSDGLPPSAREPLRRVYVDALAAALGPGRLDPAALERAWDLAWLRMFAMLGVCLADALASPHDAAERGRVVARCRDALALARRTVDRHVR